MIKDLISGKKSDPGRTGRDDRLFINAVLFVLKTGIPWEDLPSRYGKSNSVWKRYDRWCARGVWEQIFLAIGESELAEELEEMQIDSTSIKESGAEIEIGILSRQCLDRRIDNRDVITREVARHKLAKLYPSIED